MKRKEETIIFFFNQTNPRQSSHAEKLDEINHCVTAALLLELMQRHKTFKSQDSRMPNCPSKSDRKWSLVDGECRKKGKVTSLLIGLLVHSTAWDTVAGHGAEMMLKMGDNMLLCVPRRAKDSS